MLGVSLMLGIATSVSPAGEPAAAPPAIDQAPLAAQRELALQPAKLVQPRGGLGNVLAKLKAGETVRIAYFGGSITAANGWRVKSKAWFQEQFPTAKVEEIHAAIGGTGSDLGVFRLEHDVLAHSPDLVFVEFAVNDGQASPEQIWKAMEGIVRQIWARNPRIDICYVYTFRTGYETDLRQGLCPRAASAMELLAEHYGIPSINVAVRVVEMEQAGKLVFQAAEPTPTGVVRFSSDGVHPLDEGHAIYRDVIAEAIPQIEKQSPPIDHTAQLARPYVADHWQAAKMVPLAPSMLKGDWKELPATDDLAKRFGKQMGALWQAEKPGSALSFRFRGSLVKLYDLLGPDAGQVIVTVDGKTRPNPVPRFDSYTTYHRISTLTIGDRLDPAAVHTVSIEIHPEQPDRQSIAFRLKDPEQELKAEKYQGTRIRVGQIMILGDLVE